MAKKETPIVWTDRLECELLRLYKRFRCLWLPGDPGYHNLDERYVAYAEIVQSLLPRLPGIAVTDVIRKIENLRRRYCVEWERCRRSLASGCEYAPSSTWFRYVHNFLHPHVDWEREARREEKGEEKEGLPVFEDYIGARLAPATCRAIIDSRLKARDGDALGVPRAGERNGEAAKERRKRHDRRGTMTLTMSSPTRRGSGGDRSAPSSRGSGQRRRKMCRSDWRAEREEGESIQTGEEREEEGELSAERNAFDKVHVGCGVSRSEMTTSDNDEGQNYPPDSSNRTEDSRVPDAEDANSVRRPFERGRGAKADKRIPRRRSLRSFGEDGGGKTSYHFRYDTVGANTKEFRTFRESPTRREGLSRGERPKLDSEEVRVDVKRPSRMPRGSSGVVDIPEEFLARTPARRSAGVEGGESRVSARPFAAGRAEKMRGRPSFSKASRLDEFRAFGNKVGGRLRELEPSAALKLGSRILEILGEERRRMYSGGALK